MKLKAFKLSIISFIFLSISQVWALDIGKKVPDFKLTGEYNKTYSLKDFKGKPVVLEWLNHGCPFIRKHYDSQNMQKLQKFARDKGFIWLSIVSSASGKQGHVDTKGAVKEKTKYGSKASHILLDPDGKVGMAYSAKTTPHMYIIGKDRTLKYQGAIDSINSTDKEDIPKAENYVRKAIEQILAGKKVTQAKTQPYGCSVKY